MIVYRPNVTLQQVKADLSRDGEHAMLWYSLGTAWWTHRNTDLMRTATGVPCDPLGFLLGSYPGQTWRMYLALCEENAVHYGPHGLDALMAAHHANSFDSNGKPWASPAWVDYDAALDVFEASNGR
jgi:hypothetical protein